MEVLEIGKEEYAPERLNDFLSHMLCQKIKILRILPNDSTRLTDEASLLITDIVAELEDRSIANIEMQNTIDGMQGTIDGMQEKYTQALKSTVNMLRKLKIPETEIITRICEEFQMEETQVQQYLL